MAEYTPTIWECGDVVTAERLNHMEEGIEAANACCEGGGGSGSVRVVRIVDRVACEGAKSSATTHPVIDISYQEVVDGLADGTVFCFAFSMNDNPAFVYPLIIMPVETENYYEVVVAVCNMGKTLTISSFGAFCDTADGNLHLYENCWGNGEE